MPGRKTKHTDLLAALREELTGNRYHPHDRFPSEVELTRKHSVSADTVRKALRDLTDEGLIYRERWRGTFVSPRARTQKILIVTNFSTQAPAHDAGLTYGLAAFEHGMRRQNSAPESRYDLVTVCMDEFPRLSHDLRLIHRNLAGIVFFRDPVALLQARHLLKSQGIPFLFYGSDRHKPRLSGEDLYLYSEDAIVDAGLAYLQRKGHRKVLFVASSADSHPETRRRFFEQHVQKRGLWKEELTPIWMEQNRFPVAPAELTHRATALFCETDSIACAALNELVCAGIKVPGKLAVLGCNNYPLCTSAIIPLTSIDIPLLDDGVACMKLMGDLIDGRRKSIDERSRITVVPRDSA